MISNLSLLSAQQMLTLEVQDWLYAKVVVPDNLTGANMDNHAA